MVSIERWHDVEYNLNSQLLLWNGECRLLAITSQDNNDVGVYKGSDLNPHVPLHVLEHYKQELHMLGQILLDMGYQGFMGVDSIMDKQGRLIPVIEINARLTMVTYTLSMRNHLIESGFPHIYIQFFDLKSAKRIEFPELQRQVAEMIQRYRGGCFIYGFHEALEAKQQLYVYRVFVLFWEKEKGKLLDMVKEMDRIISATALTETR